MRVFTAHEHENALLNIGISTCAHSPQRKSLRLKRRDYDANLLIVFIFLLSINRCMFLMIDSLSAENLRLR